MNLGPRPSTLPAVCLTIPAFVKAAAASFATKPLLRAEAVCWTGSLCKLPVSAAADFRTALRISARISMAIPVAGESAPLFDSSAWTVPVAQLPVQPASDYSIWLRSSGLYQELAPTVQNLVMGPTTRSESVAWERLIERRRPVTVTAAARTGL